MLRAEDPVHGGIPLQHKAHIFPLPPTWQGIGVPDVLKEMAKGFTVADICVHRTFQHKVVLILNDS